ncbi:MAG TPA: peptide chain release factor N(5)-glutamine methyltransferase [Edaphobacter sp.]|nr:peptide chain release factor N(5)-glutamine methyltransferase [Edaphobacter sp.]
MTLRQALTLATQTLATSEHLRPNAHRDAELLLLHTLQIPRTTLLAYPTRELSPTEQSLFESHIARRQKNEPIQYITGQQEFYGLPFKVTPAVLIPRPETEHLVESVLHHLPHNQPLRIADIGTGSGAIAIALAVHLPQAQITALDLSSDALAIARANAETNNVANRITFLQSDLLSAITNEAHFDAIVSNPPYIPQTDEPTLHPEVRDHEPHTALFAGPEGLDIYSRLIPQAYTLLKPNGLLAFEIGHGQREALSTLLTNWHDVNFVDDLQHIPRVALATR